MRPRTEPSLHPPILRSNHASVISYENEAKSASLCHGWYTIRDTIQYDERDKLIKNCVSCLTDLRKGKPFQPHFLQSFIKMK